MCFDNLILNIYKNVIVTGWMNECVPVCVCEHFPLCQNVRHIKITCFQNFVGFFLNINTILYTPNAKKTRKWTLLLSNMSKMFSFWFNFHEQYPQNVLIIINTLYLFYTGWMIESIPLQTLTSISHTSARSMTNFQIWIKHKWISDVLYFICWLDFPFLFVCSLAVYVPQKYKWLNESITFNVLSFNFLAE